MPAAHSGYTRRDIAGAIEAVIKLADPKAYVVNHITLNFKNDAETLDASRDRITNNVNRWDIHAKNGKAQRTTNPYQCEGATFTVARENGTIFLLKFRYSVGVDEKEKDDQDKTSYDRFCDREDAVEYQFSASPYLFPKVEDKARQGLHNELQNDNRDIVPFRREWCFESSYHLAVTYDDWITKTE